MKYSIRVGFAALLVAFIAVLADSAWADVDSVAQTIEDYGLTATVSGNTITITGTKDDATTTLDLGDISGLSVDWNATLTGLGGAMQDNDSLSRRYLLRMKASESTPGNLNIIGGRIENTGSDMHGWGYAVSAYTKVNVTVSGGYIGVTGAKATALQNSNNKNTDGGGTPGTITIISGTISAPKGTAIGSVGTLDLQDTSNITGAVLNSSNFNGYSLDIYGTVTTSTDSEFFFDKYDPGDSTADSISYTAKSGATWNIEGVASDMTALPFENIVAMKVENGGKVNFKNYTNLIFKGALGVEVGGELSIDGTSHLTIVGGTATNGGIVNIDGTMINKDKIINNGTIYNYSGNTLDNQGTLTNNGTINNTANGKITNTGTIDNVSTGIITNEGNIDNTSGTINNDGTINSDEANFTGNKPTGNPLQSIDDDDNNDNDNDNSGNNKNGGNGSGGCNAGYGMIGLLLAGLAALKARKA